MPQAYAAFPPDAPTSPLVSTPSELSEPAVIIQCCILNLLLDVYAWGVLRSCSAIATRYTEKAHLLYNLLQLQDACLKRVDVAGNGG